MTVGDFKRYFVQHFLSYDMAERTSILSIIMEETLGMNQVEAILYHDQEITQEKKRELQRVCQELSKDIPIQYIYQKAHFLGLSLYVDSRYSSPDKRQKNWWTGLSPPTWQHRSCVLGYRHWKWSYCHRSKKTSAAGLPDSYRHQ